MPITVAQMVEVDRLAPQDFLQAVDRPREDVKTVVEFAPGGPYAA